MAHGQGEDPRWRAGSEAHYEDPQLYDQRYRRRDEDTGFYVEHAQRLMRRKQGRVLELGCGSGRVTLGLLGAGLDVLGVDSMAPMLEAAKRRCAEYAERVAFRKADLRRFHAREQFPLIVAPFNVFMHLYTRRDWERALSTVKRHLAPGGHLLFDILMPNLGDLNRDPDRAYKGRPVRDPHTGKRLEYREYFDYDTTTQVQMVTMTYQEPGRPETMWVSPLSHRQVYPAELETLLHYNGFRIKRRWGDFDGAPFSPQAESQILLATPRK